MELRTLRTFVAVAEAGSVTAASTELRLTQPAVTRQVQHLERELGMALFERSRSRMRLTAAGERFRVAAVDVLDRAEAALAVAETLAAGRLVKLAMAAPTTTLTDVLAPFLATMGPQDPVVTVTEAHTDQALRHLGSEVDLVIVTTPPPKAWNAMALAVLPIWAYVRDDHDWVARDWVGLDELSEHPLVVLDRTLRPRQVLQEALAQNGLALPSHTECGNAQVAQALAASGRGAAIVSDDPRFGLRQLAVRCPDGSSLVLRLYAAWNGAHHAAPALESVAARLRSFCTDRYGPQTAP